LSEKNIKRCIFKGKKKENYIKRDIFLKGKKKVVYSRGARRAGKGRESGNGKKDGRRLSPLVCHFKGEKKTGENPPLKH
jgi:hypothetical protein